MKQEPVDGFPSVAATVEAGPSDPVAVDQEMEEILPNLTQAQIEQRDRQVDLDRLNMLSLEQRRSIAAMDMMGDFGSKVSHAH